MKTELLLKLATYLEQDAVNPNGFKFDMWTWASSEKTVNDDGYFIDGIKPEPNCGTSACAMGVAAVSGIFQPEGLAYYITVDGEFEFRFNEQWTSGFSAAQSLFEITNDQSHYLFDGDCYRNLGQDMTGHAGELAVAKRIRAFAASGGEMPEFVRDDDESE